MSFLRRLLGGADPDAREDDRVDAGGGEEELEIEADERLPDDLKEFLYPQDEFILRQQRYSKYKWEPPPNEPQRDPRLAPVGELLTRTRQPTDEQVEKVVRAWKRRGHEVDALLASVHQRAAEAGRSSDLSAARGFSLGDPLEPDSEPSVPQEFRDAVTMAGEALAVRDFLSAEEIAALTAAWRAGFGELPATESAGR